MKTNEQKLRFYIKLSGWIGVFPTIAEWNMYKAFGDVAFLVTAIMTIVMSLYILITSEDPSWVSKKKNTKFIILCIFFSGIFPAIPMFMARKYTSQP